MRTAYLQVYCGDNSLKSDLANNSHVNARYGRSLAGFGNAFECPAVEMFATVIPGKQLPSGCRACFQLLGLRRYACRSAGLIMHLNVLSCSFHPAKPFSFHLNLSCPRRHEPQYLSPMSSLQHNILTLRISVRLDGQGLMVRVNGLAHS